MNARGFENLKDVRELFIQSIIPNIGEFHLDFGCGDGWGSILQAGLCPSSTIIGYDADRDKIQLANKKLESSNKNNVIFTDSLDDLDECKFASFNCSFDDISFVFDSASANFVFHETPNIFREIYSFLKEKGKLLVLDYNIKGISKRDFYKSFSLDNERRIIKKEGFKECYRKHTRFGIDDCISLGETAGFKTINTTLLEKYFLWIGDKN